jgi:hypothetical protein
MGPLVILNFYISFTLNSWLDRGKGGEVGVGHRISHDKDKILCARLPSRRGRRNRNLRFLRGKGLGIWLGGGG